MPHGLNALVVEVDETVQNRRWTEGQRRMVVVNGGIVAPIDLNLLIEVLDLVLAQGGITLNGEPRGGVYAGL